MTKDQKRLRYILLRLEQDGSLLRSRDDDYEEEEPDKSNYWLLLDPLHEEVEGRGRNRLETLDDAAKLSEGVEEDWNKDDSEQCTDKVTLTLEAYFYNEPNDKEQTVSVSGRMRHLRGKLRNRGGLNLEEAVRWIGKVVDMKVEHLRDSYRPTQSS